MILKISTYVSTFKIGIMMILIGFEVMGQHELTELDLIMIILKVICQVRSQMLISFSQCINSLSLSCSDFVGDLSSQFIYLKTTGGNHKTINAHIH